MQQPTIAVNGARSAAASTASPFLLFLIVSLFFMWGCANNLNDILIRQFQKAFTLSDFEAGLVQSAFYLGYFFLAIPAGLFMRRFGYRAAVILGLAGYASDAFLFYPAAEVHSYAFFLVALFIIASGLAFLEASANPLITLLGPKEGAARRLNLVQAFNPLGSIAGIVIGRQLILSGIEYSPEELEAMRPAAREAYFASESAAVQLPYLLIGLVVLAWMAMIAFARFPPLAVEETGPRGGSLREALRSRTLRTAVVAQFFYVGAQVGVWSYLIHYVQFAAPGTPERTAADFITASLVAFMAGRFVGTYLMRHFAPAVLLAAFAAINIALTTVAVLFPSALSIYAIVATSFFMSVMYPTIFALGIRDLGPARQIGSSLIVMAIIGGAALTAAMGRVSDLFGIQWSYAVPALCYVAVLYFAVRVAITSPDRSEDGRAAAGS